MTPLTTVIVALVAISAFTIYYKISRETARPAISIVVALGFTIITPALFAVAVVAVTVKFAQLLFLSIRNNKTV